MRLQTPRSKIQRNIKIQAPKLARPDSTTGTDSFIPEGWPTIAQRFDVASSAQESTVPKGRLRKRAFSAVPSGLTRPSSLYPNVKTLGYFRPSLRDGDD